MQLIIKIIIIPFILITSIVDNIEKWVFSYNSKIIELFNVWCLVGFGTIMLSKSTYLLKLSVYGNFVAVPSIVWVMMICVGLLHFAIICNSCNKSKQLSGIMLQLSAVIWSVIVMAFTLQPPINTALPIYTGMSILFGVTGYAKLQTGKAQEE